MVVETLRQYTVENLTDNGIKYFLSKNVKHWKWYYCQPNI